MCMCRGDREKGTKSWPRLVLVTSSTVCVCVCLCVCVCVCVGGCVSSNCRQDGIFITPHHLMLWRRCLFFME